MKFHSEDNGNCRVYYRDGAALYCWQNEGRAGFKFYRCSRDGEPSHEVWSLGGFSPSDVSMPPGHTAIGRELIAFLNPNEKATP